MKRIALIPSLEPDEKLLNIVDELKENNFEIIVVNDGSSTKYDKIFNKVNAKATLLSYKTNRGKGYALKYGFKYIKEKYDDNYIIVTVDSDGQHTAKDASRLCDYVENNPYDIAIGKRKREQNIPFRSKLGNGITKMIYFLATGIKIYDTQTGLRAFSNKLMDFSLDISGNRFEYEMNVLLFASVNRIKIFEIEIETIYINHNEGSHFNAFKDSLKIYKEIFKFSFISILTFIIDFLCFILFIFFYNNIILANILSKIISNIFNYSFNPKLTLKKKSSNYIFKYLLFTIFILIINTIILKSLILLSINVYLSKILVEFTILILNYSIINKICYNNF